MNRRSLRLASIASTALCTLYFAAKFALRPGFDWLSAMLVIGGVVLLVHLIATRKS